MSKAPLNSWVSLSNDETRIVAADKDMVEVIRLSEEAGETDFVLTKTPPFWGEGTPGCVEQAGTSLELV